MPDRSTEDPLAALREHVRHAHAAAERLAFDAVGADPTRAAARPGGGGGAGGAGATGGAGGAGGPRGPGAAGGAGDGGGDSAAGLGPGSAPEPGPQTPPSGWAAAEPTRELGGELRALFELVESLNALLPGELREQLYEVIRQILLLTRAVIDWLVERMQGPPPERPSEVQDIPIR